MGLRELALRVALYPRTTRNEIGSSDIYTVEDAQVELEGNRLFTRQLGEPRAARRISG